MIILITRCNTCRQICQTSRERARHYAATNHNSFSDEEVTDATCKSCEHWKNSIHTPTAMICDAIGSLRMKPSTEFDVFADADDDSNLHAELRTGPNFGCVHHSPVR